ncbi:MAG: hypothetical protein A2287_10660 [Candidatus Melainabacteria bacterium RIFOXYA12_FULL_32_12]|nr:MAG: hypothetical protein A2255_06665 [Candidatus Melainabacteria bacterium RIFOXYA2_FULL_32_9]OGI28744.1 MAG: hypothetical protein A2287_10660 [Candidatus Melainabacteria bacterium RIFOXYA12_FULL_32_12]
MENSVSCDHVKLLVSAYFDNELSDEEADVVDNHLNKCPLCAKELENIKNLSGLLKGFSDKFEYKESNLASTVVDRICNIKTIACNEVLDELSAYFDGELDLKLHYLVEEHVNSCASCKTELNKIEKLSSYIKSTCNMDKELNLWPDVEADLNNVDTCNEMYSNLSAFLDRELPKNEIVKISEHLLACKHCRRDYENLKTTQFAVKNYFIKSVTDKDASNKDIYNNTLEKLDKTQHRRELLTSIVAIFIMALLGWFSMNTIEPIIMKKAYGHNPKVVNPDRPVFVKYAKAEDFLFTQAFSMPQEGVISILYENN